jgi:hypothetical protein
MADKELYLKTVQVPGNVFDSSECSKRGILNLHVLASSGRIVHEQQSQLSKNKLLIFHNVYSSYVYANILPPLERQIEALLQTNTSHFAPNNCIYRLLQAKRLNT